MNEATNKQWKYRIISTHFIYSKSSSMRTKMNAVVLKSTFTNTTPFIKIKGN